MASQRKEVEVRKVFLTAVAAAALMTGLAQPSHASLMLRLSDGTTTETLTDSANSGFLLFTNALGAFTTNVTTALSAPILGSAFQPILDLNTIDIANAASSGGTLTISMTDTDFLGAGGIANFLSTIGGTLSAGSLNLSTFMDCGNSAFAETTSLTSQNFSSTPFSGSANSLTPACSGAYSLTQILTLNLPGGSFFSGDATLAVPEPSTIATLGAGILFLAGFGWVERRRNSG